MSPAHLVDCRLTGSPGFLLLLLFCPFSRRGEEEMYSLSLMKLVHLFLQPLLQSSLLPSAHKGESNVTTLGIGTYMSAYLPASQSLHPTVADSLSARQKERSAWTCRYNSTQADIKNANSYWIVRTPSVL